MLTLESNQLNLAWSRNFSDLEEILVLRKSCFPGVRDILSADDLRARHLMIRNHENRLVGTYRVSLSTEVQRFEAEDDFIIHELLQKEGTKVELSWACVDPVYRDGKVIHLLWRGLSELFKQHRVRYVFGLASVSCEGIQQIQDIVRYLHKNSYLAEPHLVQARRGALSEKALLMAEGFSEPSPRRFLPGLLRAYLMAGALVCRQPVFDASIGCYDFMTVLDTECASGPLRAHFKFD